MDREGRPSGARWSLGSWNFLAFGGRRGAAPGRDSGPEVIPIVASAPNPARAADPEPRAGVTCSVVRGVVEVRDPRMIRTGREAFCRALVEAVVSTGAALRAEVCLATSTFRAEFGPGRFDRSTLAGRVESAIREATPAARVQGDRRGRRKSPWQSLSALVTDRGWLVWEAQGDGRGRLTLVKPRPHQRPPAEDPAGSLRLGDLALASGSFALAVAGLVLPGIPAAPFLMLTAHFLVRASPSLRRRLGRLPRMADLLREIESGRALRIDARSLLKAAGVGALAGAAFVAVHPPLPVVLAIELGLVAFAGVRALTARDGRAAAAA